MNLDITLGEFRLRMTHSAAVTAGDVEALLRSLEELIAGLPLDRARFEGAGAAYTYRIWLIGGRLWQQDVTFQSAPDNDPLMTFSVVPAWKESEFVCQRAWRASCKAMRNRCGCTLLRIDAA